jgi:hypothetical protein
MALIPFGWSLDRLLTIAALTPTAAVVAYGGFITISNPEGRAASVKVAAAQELLNQVFVLQYADENKAVFKTDTGFRLAMIGTSLDDAGHVASIEKIDGEWTVTTDRGVVFVLHTNSEGRS